MDIENLSEIRESYVKAGIAKSQMPHEYAIVKFLRPPDTPLYHNTKLCPVMNVHLGGYAWAFINFHGAENFEKDLRYTIAKWYKGVEVSIEIIQQKYV